jgi:glutaredoxin
MFWRRLLGWWKSHTPAEGQPLPLVFYTRAGCPLCDEALALLRPYLEKKQVRVEVRNVDADPQWRARYSHRVPVIEVDGKPRLWGRIHENWLGRLIRFHRR